MAMSNNQRQQLYRARYNRMKAALEAIVEKLGDSDKPNAIAIAEIAREGLK